MLSVTERRNLTRKVKAAIRDYETWSSATLRERPEALMERDQALIRAHRLLKELTQDHAQEVRIRLDSVARATARLQRQADRQREEGERVDHAASA
jgi:t-SNARE complex subunit (syntaxin)